MKLVLILSLATLAGCATPPATQISFNPTTKAINIVSPKQISADEISVQMPDGGAVKIKKLKSENDAAILGVLMQQNLAQGEQLLKLVDKLNTTAAKGATGGLVP